MFLIPRCTGSVDDLKSGEYRRTVGVLAGKGFSAIVRCPGCGKTSSLGPLHTVADDGTVTPSFVCPHAPCPFHEWVRLLDWTTT